RSGARHRAGRVERPGRRGVLGRHRRHPVSLRQPAVPGPDRESGGSTRPLDRDWGRAGDRQDARRRSLGRLRGDGGARPPSLPRPSSRSAEEIGMTARSLTERALRHAAHGMALAVLLAGALGASGAPVCAPDAVIAGARCIDKFEASVWRVPNPTTANAPLVAKIQKGTATGADLSVAGARQLGTAGDDYEPCTDQGESCADLYAVSLLSRGPSAFVTWFQAQEACANSGKRLPTSAEWQVAANGAPDPGPDDGGADCNTCHFPVVVGTGARRRCVSARGAFDMVGNHEEWTADWVAATQICTGWGVFSNDVSRWCE